MKQQYAAIIEDERVDVALNRTGTGVEASIGNRTYQLDAIAVEPGVFCFTWNQRSIEAIVTEDRDGYIVSIGGYRFRVELLDPRKALRRAALHGHEGVVELRAPMPGKIVRVLVEEGSNVEANQGIVVMEAMKMQNEIRSPKRGKIQKLSVVEGAAVSSGDVIALVE